MVEADKGIAARLDVWVEMNECQGRTVTVRQDFETACLVYEAWEKETSLLSS